jgi:ribosomal protein S18 acetylase RimI-like enzyme
VVKLVQKQAQLDETSWNLPHQFAWLLKLTLHRCGFDSRVVYRQGFATTTPTSDQLTTCMAEGPIWLAVQDEVVLGTVSVVSRGDESYIRGMAVVPQARGLGLGELLKTVEEFALAHARIW